MLSSSGQIQFNRSSSIEKKQEQLKKQHKIPESIFTDFVQILKTKEEGVNEAEKVVDRPMEGIEIPKAEKPDIEVKIQEDTNQERLDLLSGNARPLIRISTHVPINLFPKEIVVDVNKVTLISKEILGAKQVVSISIEDITDVIVETIPFFATMKIFDKGFAQNSIRIRFLKKYEALKVRKIIQGLMAVHKAKIDLSKVDQDTLFQKLEEVGKAEEKV